MSLEPASAGGGGSTIYSFRLDRLDDANAEVSEVRVNNAYPIDADAKDTLDLLFERRSFRSTTTSKSRRQLGQRPGMSLQAGRYDEAIRARLEARGAADPQRQTGQ
jgi:hypothetical protein